MTDKECKKIKKEEDEYKSKRKQIQEKLIKFATRIPVFMYLTDYREYCLKDVISQLEPPLFKKVTGLEIKDFELLVSLGVFNDSLMNDAVYKFKRYEDASLSYTGINRHDGENSGGWNTVISKEDYNKMFALQQESINFVQSQMLKKQNSFVPIKKQKQIQGEKTSKERISLSKAIVKKSETKQEIDFSHVKIGSKLKHKAFGVGTVKNFAKGIVIVSFGKTDKMFQFPGAILQGFLTILK